MTTDTATQQVSVWKDIVLIAFVVIVAGAAGGYWYYFKYRPSVPRMTNEISESVRAGEYDLAIAKYRDIADDPTATSNVFARAVLNAAPARLKAADSKEALSAVADLKKIAADWDVKNSLKARAITVLANAYNESGERSDVWHAIYDDPLYHSFAVRSHAITMRNTLEWSYALHPTSRAAIGIATSYIKDPLRLKYPPPGFTQEEAVGIDSNDSLAKAKKYLEEGDRLFAQEMRDPDFDDKNSYAAYRYWHTFIIGMLAYIEGGEYKNTYRKEFDEYIAYFERNGNVESSQYLDFAYWNYAAFLVFVDKDEAAAETQLQKLVAHVRNDPYYDYNEFVLVTSTHIKHHIQTGERNFDTESIETLGKLSLEFKRLIEDITGANATSGAKMIH